MNPNTIINFSLSIQEINIILMALQEIPAKLCNPLSETLKAQAQAHLQAMEPAKDSVNTIH